MKQIVEGDKVNVKEQTHIQLRTDYNEQIFIIDIVKKEYFEKFLDLIEKDHLEFVNVINKIHFPEEHKSRLKTKHKQEMKEFEKYVPLEMYGGKVEQEWPYGCVEKNSSPCFARLVPIGSV